MVPSSFFAPSGSIIYFKWKSARTATNRTNREFATHTSIDPVTGKKTINPDLIPGTGKPMVVCPHAGGGGSWIPGAINPDTRMLYVPAVETCMDLNPVAAGARGFLSTGVSVNLRPRPDSDGRYGRIQAINLETKKTVWTERQRAPQSSGVLATAGGLVFAGALDRWLGLTTTAPEKKCGRFVSTTCRIPRRSATA
jgi:hypothetical protein